MAGREIHLELLMGKEVRGITGAAVGRIEEVRAVRAGDDWVIAEFWIGPGAAVIRLAGGQLLRILTPLLGPRAAPHGYRVRWDQLDLSDVDNPRLRCRQDQLRRLDPATVEQE